DQVELTMQVAPFPHPQQGQELLLAQSTQLTSGQILALLFKVRPQIQQGNEVGIPVSPGGMPLVGLLLLFQWPLPRILTAESTGDDLCFPQTTVRRCFDQNT